MEINKRKPRIFLIDKSVFSILNYNLFISFLNAKVGKRNIFNPNLLNMYFKVETFWEKNCFTLSIFGVLNVRVKEHTELWFKDEIRLELCMFKNSIHQSQEGLRRFKEIPKLQSLSCDENVLHCARRLTCNADITIVL